MRDATEQIGFCDIANTSQSKDREPMNDPPQELQRHRQEAKLVTKFRFPARSRYAQLVDRETDLLGDFNTS